MSRPDSWTTNIQYKGTDLCMDFICPSCGRPAHFDGMFIFAIRCPGCRKVFVLPTDVPLVAIEDLDPKDYRAKWSDFATEAPHEDQCIHEGEQILVTCRACNGSGEMDSDLAARMLETPDAR